MIEALIISNIVLWVALIVMALVIFALTRQIGVLYERVAPAGALMVNKALEVGMPAPEVSANTLEGKTLLLGGQTQEKSQLLFFLSPDCPICKTLLPVIKSAVKSEGSWFNVVLASDGEEHDHRSFVAEHELNAFPYVVSEILGKTYGVAKLPYGVLIDDKGQIASMGIINSREHLESLFEAKEHNVASIQQYMQQQQDNNEMIKEVR